MSTSKLFRGAAREAVQSRARKSSLSEKSLSHAPPTRSDRSDHPSDKSAGTITIDVSLMR
jgi:hypothetical protein